MASLPPSTMAQPPSGVSSGASVSWRAAESSFTGTDIFFQRRAEVNRERGGDAEKTRFRAR